MTKLHISDKNRQREVAVMTNAQHFPSAFLCCFIRGQPTHNFVLLFVCKPNSNPMKIDPQALDEFKRPWEFDNTFGVLEIPFDEIETSGSLGSGKKGSTVAATWKGQSIALKSWKCGCDAGPYSQWELLVYCHLKSLQGTLVPKLHFISHEPDGCLVFGLELGRPRHCVPRSEMNEAMDEISQHGWTQRSVSIRSDNFVCMANEDGTERLVATDLESFIPVFGVANPVKPPAYFENTTFYGIPVVHPWKSKFTASIKRMTGMRVFNIREAHGTGKMYPCSQCAMIHFTLIVLKD